MHGEGEARPESYAARHVRTVEEDAVRQALRGAETLHERRVVAQRREVFQAALSALDPTDPALYSDTETILRALAVALARALQAPGDS